MRARARRRETERCVYTYVYTHPSSRGSGRAHLFGSCRRSQETRVTLLHVDLIRPACTTCPPSMRYRRRCFMRPPLAHSGSLRCHYTPPPLLTSDTAGISEGYAYVYSVYVCGTNILGRTACEHASAKLVRFDSIPPLVFCLLRLALRAPVFFFSVSLSPDLHDPVSPPGTIDPRLTLHGAVSLNSIYDACLFSSFLSSGFPPVFFVFSPNRRSIIADSGMIIWNFLVYR